MMVNQLEMLFSNQPTNTTRLLAFMLWLNGDACIAIRATIVFHFGRQQMIRVGPQLAVNHGKKLLAYINDAPLIRKIE